MTFVRTIILSFILSICFIADATHPVLSKPTLKVLDIGNSYTTDATDLLPLITEASGADISNICIYKAVRSSASFKSWYDVYYDKDTARKYTIKKVLGGLAANVSTGTGAKGDGSLFRKLLTDEKWDIIIIHFQRKHYRNSASLNDTTEISGKHPITAFYIIDKRNNTDKRFLTHVNHSKQKGRIRYFRSVLA